MSASMRYLFDLPVLFTTTGCRTAGSRPRSNPSSLFHSPRSTPRALADPVLAVVTPRIPTNQGPVRCAADLWRLCREDHIVRGLLAATGAREISR